MRITSTCAYGLNIKNVTDVFKIWNLKKLIHEIFKHLHFFLFLIVTIYS